VRKALVDDFTATKIEVDPDVLAEVVSDTIGQLVADLNRDQKASVKRFTQRALKEGWDEVTLADRINGAVGLDSRRVIAVENYRNGLIDRGVPKGDARRQAQEYAKRLRRERAEVIARTEMANLVGEAKRRSWIQARLDGVIDQYAVRVWHTAPDEMKCPVCKPMNGQRAAIDRPYQRGMAGPPVHPNCRCWETLERGPVVLAKGDEPALDDSFKYRDLVRKSQ
jgi:SPP1 gp7 family putative phage head morphogenesis protein